MRRLFGFTILNSKESARVIKQLNYMGSLLDQHDQRIRNVNDTLAANSMFSNENFKKHRDNINDLIKRVNELEGTLRLITKNN